MNELANQVSDYKTWVSAWLDNWPKQPSLAAEHLMGVLLKIEGKEYKKELPKSLWIKPDAVKKWAERGSIPSKPKWKECLILAIEGQIRKPPSGLKTQYDFRTLIDLLERQRFSGDSLQAASEALFQKGVIRTLPSSAEDFDRKTLQLGSSITQGEVPPYVAREVDERLVSLLNDPNRRSLFVLGTAKSGKTRSLIEALSQSNKSKWPVYLLSSLTGSIEEFLKVMKGASAKHVVVFLDDFQRFPIGLGKSGINSETIAALSSLGLLVSTVDKLTIASLTKESINSGYKNNHAGGNLGWIQTQILDNTEEIPLDLTGNELEKANKVFHNQFSANQLQRLGAFLSSGDVLVENFHTLRTTDMMGLAVSEALIKCKVLFPLGFDLDLISTIAQHEFQILAPNGLWHDLLFQSKILGLTSGTYPGSSHTVLVRSANDSGFRLSDYVWEKISPTQLSLDTELLEEFASPDAASNAWRIGFDELALEILDSYLGSHQDEADAHGLRAEILFGIRAFEESLEAFRQAYKLSASKGNWIVGLSKAYSVVGKLPAARELLKGYLEEFSEDNNAKTAYLSVLSRLGLKEEALSVSKTLEPNETYPLVTVLLNQGFALSELSRFSEAKELYDKANDLEPNSCEVTASLIGLFARMEETSTGMKLGESHLSFVSCDKTCRAMINLGNLYIDLDKIDEARSVAKRFEKSIRVSEGYFNLLGRLEWASGNLESAIEFFEVAVSLEPWSSTAYGNLGEALGEAGRLDEARDAFLAGLRLDEVDDQCNAGLGITNYLQGDLVEALKYLKAALSISRRTHTIFMTARVLGELRQFGEAIQLFEEAHMKLSALGKLKIKEWHYSYYSDCLVEIGDFDRALKILKEQHAVFGSVESLVALSDLMRLSGKSSAAKRIIEVEIRNNPNKPELYVAKALLLENLSQYEEALSALRESSVSKSKDLFFVAKKAELELRLNRIEEAIETIQEIWSDEGTNAHLLGIYVAALRAAGRLKESESLEHNFEEFANSREREWALISGDYLAGNEESLVARINKFIKSFPDAPQALELRGELHFRNDELVEAIECFRRALSMDPKMVTSAVWLIEALSETGSQKEAERFHQTYLNSTPLTSAAKEYLARAAQNSVKPKKLVNQAGSTRTQRLSSQLKKSSRQPTLDKFSALDVKGFQKN